MTLPPEEFDPTYRRRFRSTTSRLVMAAMLGLVDAFGFERPSTDVVQFAPDLTTGELPLSFGPLPPLD